MPSMVDMVEAHLLNVQREIKTLHERKVNIDQEIARLEAYLIEGQAELQHAQSTVPAQAEAPTSTVFDPTRMGSRP